MSIFDILRGLKNKTLDAANYELLVHAYELQEKSGSQLQVLNDTLTQVNTHLKKEVADLKASAQTKQDEVDQLVAELEYLKSQHEPVELNDEQVKVLVTIATLQHKKNRLPDGRPVQAGTLDDVAHSCQQRPERVAHNIDYLMKSKLVMKSLRFYKATPKGREELANRDLI